MYWRYRYVQADLVVNLITNTCEACGLDKINLNETKVKRIA